MSDMPWVRFFPSDWLAGTRGMSAVETGIYITLIATMYERGEPVPEDQKRLARLCGASGPAFRKALDSLVSEGKITRADGRLWNNRVAKEIEFRAEKSQLGSRAANARWEKKLNDNKGGGDADALHRQSERNANQKPDTITITREEKKETPSGAVASDGKVSETDLFRYGKSVLGPKAGGVITKLKRMSDHHLPEAMRVLQMAAEKENPMEWLHGVMRASDASERACWGAINVKPLRAETVIETREDREYRAREKEIYAGVL